MNVVDSIFNADTLSRAETWERGARAWPGNEQQLLTCVRIADETHDVRTFEFRTPVTNRKPRSRSDD